MLLGALAFVLIVAVLFFYNKKDKSTPSVVNPVVTVDQMFNQIQSQLPNLNTTQIGEVKAFLSSWVGSGNQTPPSIDQIKSALGI